MLRQALGALSGWIGWLGASVAGLTALCYGAGYFVIHTHLTMLGLSGVVDIPTDQLLLEGGRFFYFTLARIVEAGLALAVTATAVSLIASTASRMRSIRDGWAQSFVRRRVGDERRGKLAPYLPPLAAIVLVILHYNLYYDRLTSLQVLKNLVFAPVHTDPGTLADQVEPRILSGSDQDRDVLITTYSVLVWNYALFVSIAWLIVHRGARTGFGRAANLLVVLYAVLLTASLPTAFAMLVRSPIYPAANLVFRNGHVWSGVVLQRTDHEVVLWHPTIGRAATYNRDDVSDIEVIGERDIFQKEGRQ